MVVVVLFVVAVVVLVVVVMLLVLAVVAAVAVAGGGVRVGAGVAPARGSGTGAASIRYKYLRILSGFIGAVFGLGWFYRSMGGYQCSGWQALQKFLNIAFVQTEDGLRSERDP